jgi:AcrR family transcriptional regulator
VAVTARNAPSLTKKGSETRKALLDSTITLLASNGYAATTTQAVLDHSGLSRGSLLHQFKTRDLLMVAAAEEAVERMFNAVEERLSRIADPIELLRRYPSVQWEVENEPPARACAELRLASRWEKALQPGLRRYMRSANERIRRSMHDIAEAAGLRNVNQLIIEVGALISSMQGLAVGSTLMEDEQTVQAILHALIGHYNDCLESSIPSR